MLCVLLAGIIGIICGLCVEFILCIALCFLLFVACVILKLNLSKCFLLICCSLIFYIYTGFEINKYDNRYIDGMRIDGDFKIISCKYEKEYYDKYIVKSSSKDKFYIFLPKGEELKKGTIIHATR